MIKNKSESKIECLQPIITDISTNEISEPKKTELLKVKVVKNKECNRSLLNHTQNKFEISRNINISARVKLFPLENVQISQKINSEYGQNIKLSYSDLKQSKQIPFCDLMKSYEENKYQTFHNIKSESQIHNKGLIDNDRQKGLKTAIQNIMNQEQVYKSNPSQINSEQPIKIFDKEQLIKEQKETNGNHKKHLNHRVQTLQTDRIVESLNSLTQISPSKQQLTQQSLPKQKNNIKESLKPFSSLNQLDYVNKNQFNLSSYQYSQPISTKNNSVISSKNQSSTFFTKSQNIFAPQRRQSRKAVSEFQLDKVEMEDEKSENNSLYILYRAQQREQDIKLKELSNRQRNSLRRSSSVQRIDNNSKIINYFKENKNNQDITKQQQKILLNQQEQQENIYEKKQQEKNILERDTKQSKSTSQLIINEDKQSNSTTQLNNKYGYKRMRMNFDRYQMQDDGTNYNRSKSLQQFIASRTNKSIVFDQMESIDDKDDNIDQEETTLYPFSQVLKKKVTQDATLQTSFTETLPELIAKELELVSKQKNMTTKKKERLISYFSVNDKKFLQKTTDYLKKYETDQKTQNDNQQTKERTINKNQEIMSSEDIHYQKTETQEIKQEQNNQVLDTCTLQQEQNEIKLFITVHTSKEEFLTQFNKKFQKIQQNNFEKKKFQTFYKENKSLIDTSYQCTLDDTQNTQTITQNQLSKKVVFLVESDEILQKIKESSNIQLYELFKSYKLNGILCSTNTSSFNSTNLRKDNEQISIRTEQPEKFLTKVNHYSKGKIMCHIILQKQRSKTQNHNDKNIQQNNGALKSQLLYKYLFNK